MGDTEVREDCMNVFFEHLTNEREERDWPVVGRGGGGRRGFRNWDDERGLPVQRHQARGD